MTVRSLTIILRVVNNYIGVNGGYLGDFTYRTHEEFYPEFCELALDPTPLQGTTRQRFMTIFERSDSATQAKILRGVLKRFPVGSSPLRTVASAAEIQEIIQELEAGCGVKSATTKVSSAVVDRAIADAEALLRHSGATSGVDRMHTAFHGFLRAVCDSAAIPYEQDAPVTALYGALRKSHPLLRDFGWHGHEIDKILRSLASAVDALNTLRNRASVAHPNANLLQREEAYLYVNTVRTLMAYLDAKVAEGADLVNTRTIDEA